MCVFRLTVVRKTLASIFGKWSNRMSPSGSLVEYETCCDACLPPTAVIAGRKRQGSLPLYRGSPEKPRRSADSRSSAACGNGPF
jgi:hypothetical protein